VKALDPKTQKFANTIIIPRLTEVPCSRTRTFATKQDNQERVEVEVLQGEHPDPNSPEVHLVGRVQLKNLPPHKAGELIIEVTLSYDADGVIEVTARESKSGQTIREVVMSKVGSLSPDIIQERKEMLAGMEV
jgi:molecular chaperone DnaK